MDNHHLNLGQIHLIVYLDMMTIKSKYQKYYFGICFQLQKVTTKQDGCINIKNHYILGIQTIGFVMYSLEKTCLAHLTNHGRRGENQSKVGQGENQLFQGQSSVFGVECHYYVVSEVDTTEEWDVLLFHWDDSGELSQHVNFVRTGVSIYDWSKVSVRMPRWRMTFIV